MNRKGILLAGGWQNEGRTLDLRLPDCCGLEVAEGLRARATTRSVPIVFLTGRVPAHFRDTCRDLDPAYFVCKPYDPPMLVRFLNCVIDDAIESPCA